MMHSCYGCGNTIAFGPVKAHGFHFCSKACHAQKAPLLQAMLAIPDEVVLAEAWRIHNGPCARCKKHGGVDLHKSVFVWSAVVTTRIGEQVFVGCRGCAQRFQLVTTFRTLLLGWWAVPLGIIFTPLATMANVRQLLTSRVSRKPGEMLLKYARERLAILSLPEPNIERGKIVETWTESDV